MIHNVIDRFAREYIGTNQDELHWVVRKSLSIEDIYLTRHCVVAELCIEQVTCKD